MSKENAEKFYEALKSDKALAEEMQNALKSLKIENDEQAQNAVSEFAGKKGFAFTAAELAEWESESRELDDDDLDKVNAAGCFCVGNFDHGACSCIGKDFKTDQTKCFIIGV